MEVLQAYELLDTDPDEVLDDCVEMAAKVCETPMALITLLDDKRQWFKARKGIDLTETSREMAICEHALRSRDLLLVPDTHKDERFFNSPLVTGSPRIRFYAGAPLVSPEAAALGTLCVLDRAPRKLERVQTRALALIADKVMAHLNRLRPPKGLRFGPDGHLPPGLHDSTLSNMQRLVSTTPYREQLWLKLLTFLSLPILSQNFSHVYISGSFVSTKKRPADIDVVLQTVDPYGPDSLSALSFFFRIGLERFQRLYSVHLHFWLEGAPGGMADFRRFFQYSKESSNAHGPDPRKQGLIRIDLRRPDIIAQFHRALELASGACSEPPSKIPDELAPNVD